MLAGPYIIFDSLSNKFRYPGIKDLVVGAKDLIVVTQRISSRKIWPVRHIKFVWNILKIQNVMLWPGFN